MLITPDPQLIEIFQALIDVPANREQAAQDFIEKNTTLFYPPVELNHGVHLDLLISKFRLDTSLTTDFAYLTKSSGVWYLVLVELEDPATQLFTKSAQPTAELTQAIAQVGTWRTFVARNSSEVFRRIEPLKRPLEWNQIVAQYALIIGRTTEFQADQRKIDAFRELQHNFRVLTYDSLLHAYQRKPNPVLDVIRQTKEKFTFKYRHRVDSNLFSWLTPNDFELSDEDIVHYKGRGYDIDSWLKGESLVVDQKHTKEKFLPSIDAMLAAATPKPSD